MQFVIDHASDIIAALTATVAAASAIAAVFGKSDNKYIEMARKLVNILALNFGKAENKE